MINVEESPLSMMMLEPIQELGAPSPGAPGGTSFEGHASSKRPSLVLSRLRKIEALGAQAAGSDSEFAALGSLNANSAPSPASDAVPAGFVFKRSTGKRVTRRKRNKKKRSSSLVLPSPPNPKEATSSSSQQALGTMSDSAVREGMRPFQLELEALTPLDPKFSERLHSWEGQLPPKKIDDASHIFGQDDNKARRTDTDFEALTLDEPNFGERLGYWEEKKGVVAKPNILVEPNQRPPKHNILGATGGVGEEWKDYFQETLGFWKNLDSEGQQTGGPFPAVRSEGGEKKVPIYTSGSPGMRSVVEMSSSSSASVRSGSPALDGCGSAPDVRMGHPGDVPQLKLCQDLGEASGSGSSSVCANSAPSGGLPISKKLRKSQREKMRRMELKEGFAELAEMLAKRSSSLSRVPKKTEKVAVLSEAISLIRKLQQQNQELLKDKAMLRCEMVNLTSCLSTLSGPRYPHAFTNGKGCIKPSEVVSAVKREAPALQTAISQKKKVMANIVMSVGSKRKRRASVIPPPPLMPVMPPIMMPAGGFKVPEQFKFKGAPVAPPTPVAACGPAVFKLPRGLPPPPSLQAVMQQRAAVLQQLAQKRRRQE